MKVHCDGQSNYAFFERLVLSGKIRSRNLEKTFKKMVRKETKYNLTR